MKRRLRQKSSRDYRYDFTEWSSWTGAAAVSLTGCKWELVAASDQPEKYVICNGDEGDPGAFMDRIILESYPLRVIEGMIIAGYAVGAKGRNILYPCGISASCYPYPESDRSCVGREIGGEIISLEVTFLLRFRYLRERALLSVERKPL